jgi:hypothetical protein
MTEADRTCLLHGPYVPPPVRKGNRAFCLYRSCDVVVTGWTDAPIPWPRCRALHHRGGSGLLVTAELRRAILSESAAALKHWLGVGTKAVWAWRKSFGVSRTGTDGSRRLHRASSEKGAARTRGKALPAEQVERRRPTRAPGLAEYLRGKRWAGTGWTAEQLALLGTVPDDVVAARFGRSENAVRVWRGRLGIPPFQGRPAS